MNLMGNEEELIAEFEKSVKAGSCQDCLGHKKTIAEQQKKISDLMTKIQQMMADAKE